MENKYKGVIVEESLKDNRIINDLKITGFKITKEQDPKKRWHLYTISVPKKNIKILAKNIKPGWYMHFWKNRNVIVVFRNKKFEFDYDNKASWKPAIEYGLSIGIPRAELDFPIN